MKEENKTVEYAYIEIEIKEGCEMPPILEPIGLIHDGKIKRGMRLNPKIYYDGEKRTWVIENSFYIKDGSVTRWLKKVPISSLVPAKEKCLNCNSEINEGCVCAKCWIDNTTYLEDDGAKVSDEELEQMAEDEIEDHPHPDMTYPAGAVTKISRNSFIAGYKTALKLINKQVK